jgi:hypothetical protein
VINASSIAIAECCLIAIRSPNDVKAEFPMAIQTVMDHTGDTRHSFDAGDRAAIEVARKRFSEFTGAGFTAAVRTGPGEQRIIRTFDDKAEETLFFPRLIGG